MHLYETSLKEEGVFTCIAKNRAGEDSAHTNVYVVGGKFFYSTNENLIWFIIIKNFKMCQYLWRFAILVLNHTCFAHGCIVNSDARYRLPVGLRLCINGLLSQFSLPCFRNPWTKHILVFRIGKIQFPNHIIVIELTSKQNLKWLELPILF